MLNSNNPTSDNAHLMTNTSAQTAEDILEDIQRFIQLKQLDSARSLSLHLCSEQPDFAPAWHVASVIAMLQDKPALALQHIHHALTLLPDNQHWQLHKARLLFINRQRAQARDLAITLSNNSHTSAAFCAELALLLNKLGLHQLSLDCYAQAVSLQPENAQLLFNLASLQRVMGKLTDAQCSLDRLIKLNPRDSEAWLLRSSLIKQTPEHNHLSELNQALQKQQQGPIERAQLYYAQAKELEDLQRFDESFTALQQGASVRRGNMQYSLDNDVQSLEKIAQVFDASVFEQSIAGCQSREPIFIVGLPRTGSTLVERIIGSHTDVHSAGELNNFAIEMMQQVRKTLSKPPSNKLQLIEATRHLDFKALGKSYIESTRPDTDVCPRFIDKLPLNSLYIGLIHLALPNAKIVYVQRNPMDTCLAIFKQIFTQGYPFSYDLDELSRYQIAHYKLMDHWQQVMPGKIHTLSYEELVVDLEGQTKALLAYCDLPFQAQCCAFEQSSAAATTASAAQVRQPVYTSSVGKWKHYTEQLASVQKRFEQAGIKCK
ncbi:tetratricopeptide repeat-containing sulfotransferase family protein [Aliiglaciecola sp. LCG003]|uniref:tetratricopeptide repeat-containing sulfotransferase family protein n=1 Tax=Aliiglaciecola sp. LCG003 TaxID=3053655 RepID=UPI0025748840|nr:tetratricopeptide repeat-containing sulfotransferase family protein [Aliiglaciecola sp. LCG003]WJG10103.1 sulfotransferase [Aliiglaciecola sp. LCG003]